MERKKLKLLMVATKMKGFIVWLDTFVRVSMMKEIMVWVSMMSTTTSRLGVAMGRVMCRNPHPTAQSRADMTHLMNRHPCKPLTASSSHTSSSSSFPDCVSFCWQRLVRFHGEAVGGLSSHANRSLPQKPHVVDH
jgi:hypothetical protein